jgi:SAM-dependent MidA family methyltransferase
MTLIARLHQRLNQQGDLSFVDFMHMALYDHQFGYYATNTIKFGASGDFITAPELTPLFGRTLANQCQEILSPLKTPIILEFGAGSGRLCVDILTELEKRHCLPKAYYILDISTDLRQRQQALIAREIPTLANRVSWLSRVPDAFNGVIIANEVLDAMPVHRICQDQDSLYESFITRNNDYQLTEIWKPCINQRLLTYLEPILPKTQQPYYSEVNLFVEGWLQQCATMLKSGAMIIIDYGFPRHEFYHPDRHQGTLMCHYRHHCHTNPLIYIGEQDITAHVDFTQVAEAAVGAKFHVAAFNNQAAFLLANGLLDYLADSLNERDYLHAQQAVKQLIQPNEMGELFKVMVLTKQLDNGLTHLNAYDKRASL